MFTRLFDSPRRIVFVVVFFATLALGNGLPPLEPLPVESIVQVTNLTPRVAGAVPQRVPLPPSQRYSQMVERMLGEHQRPKVVPPVSEHVVAWNHASTPKATRSATPVTVPRVAAAPPSMGPPLAFATQNQNALPKETLPRSSFVVTPAPVPPQAIASASPAPFIVQRPAPVPPPVAPSVIVAPAPIPPPVIAVAPVFVPPPVPEPPVIVAPPVIAVAPVFVPPPVPEPPVAPQVIAVSPVPPRLPQPAVVAEMIASSREHRPEVVTTEVAVSRPPTRPPAPVLETSVPVIPTVPIVARVAPIPPIPPSMVAMRVEPDGFSRSSHYVSRVPSAASIFEEEVGLSRSGAFRNGASLQ